jgi:hypothetical protein
MKNDKLSRRDFMRNTSLVAAGTITGALAGEGQAVTGPVHTSKDLPSVGQDEPDGLRGQPGRTLEES